MLLIYERLNCDSLLSTNIYSYLIGLNIYESIPYKSNNPRYIDIFILVYMKFECNLSKISP